MKEYCHPCPGDLLLRTLGMIWRLVFYSSWQAVSFVLIAIRYLCFLTSCRPWCTNHIQLCKAIIWYFTDQLIFCCLTLMDTFATCSFQYHYILSFLGKIKNIPDINTKFGSELYVSVVPFWCLLKCFRKTHWSGSYFFVRSLRYPGAARWSTNLTRKLDW